MDNLLQPSRNEDNGIISAVPDSISEQNNIYLSVGGTVYNINDNGNVRYLMQTPQSLQEDERAS